MDSIIGAKSPRFSIIVPVYNSESYLDQCIQSILNQSYQNFELLLVNDGSFDTSGEICENYAELDSRVRVYHKPNGGVSSARNLGLDYACGEWIVFCDSDDWVFSSWLSNFLCDIDVDLICQGIRYDNLLLESKEFPFEDVSCSYKGDVIGLLESMFDLGVIGYTPIKCFKRSILDEYKIRFDQRFNFREDEEFVLKYLQYCTKVLSVAEIGYNYVVPDYEHKYVCKQNMYALYASLFNCASRISVGTDYNYYVAIKNDIISQFLEDFNDINGLFAKMRAIFDLKKVLGKSLLTTNLFYVTKYSIYLDFTMVLSVVVINLHLLFKRWCEMHRRVSKR